MYTQQYQAVKDELKYLESNTIGITLLLNRQFFVNGKLKVCKSLNHLIDQFLTYNKTQTDLLPS